MIVGPMEVDVPLAITVHNPDDVLEWRIVDVEEGARAVRFSLSRMAQDGSADTVSITVRLGQ